MNLWQWLFRSEARKSDLDAEIATHMEMAVADRVARGEDSEAARRGVEREFGNSALVKDITRQSWGWGWLERLQQDLKYALRQLRKSPGFAFTVIGTLGLGIGAATAMFTVVDHVMLRPLPYQDAGKLVAIHEANSQGKEIDSGAPWLDIEAWGGQSHSFEQIAFSGRLPGRTYLQGNTTSMQVGGVSVSPNLFPVLGVSPSLGRGFVQEPVGFTPGKDANTVVLSDAVWKTAYGADPKILGKIVKINADSYTVIGVMPPGFHYPFDPSALQVWIPFQLADRDKTRTDATWSYEVVARLRYGTNIEAAATELNAIQKRVAVNYTDSELREQRSGIAVKSYADSLVKADLRKALLALLAASGVLWLIACVNVTNLLLARSSARHREIAMRGALGASRWRLTQQLIIEGLVLSGAAASLGILLSIWAVKLFQHATVSHVPIHISAGVNFNILAALVGLTLLSAMLSSAWPALMAAYAPIGPALKQGGQQSGISRAQNRVRSVLVVTEIAMSLILLVACGLLLRTIYTLRHVPLGYRTDHIIVASLDIPSYRFAGGNTTTDLYEPLLERVERLPRVQAAGFMSQVPLGQNFNIQLGLRLNGRSISSKLKFVSPSIQRIFAFNMLAGRFFNEQDTATSQPAIVVNRAFARLHSPDKHDPAAILGTHLLNLRKNTEAQIIGILDDEKQKSIAEPSQPEVEVSISQITPDSGLYQPTTMAMDLALRTDRSPASIIPDLRSILRKASPELESATIITMDQIVEDSYGSQTLAAHLLEIFGGSALLLCVAGLYGLLAYIVTQRTREIGVRIALGAQRGNVLWLVLRQAGAMVIAGVVIGTGLAVLGGKLVRSYLYGVSTHDAWTLGAVALLLLVCGLLAAWLPARRAANVNPVEALRAE